MELLFYAAPDAARAMFRQNWMEIKQVVDDSQKEIRGDTLYVGCSVAAQLFPNNRGNQLTSTANTYAIGNYFLIKNAVERNPQLKTVIYLSVPDMIGLKVANEKTYSYFLKPFYTLKNKAEIDSSKTVHGVLARDPLLFLCVFNSFKVIRTDDFNYFDGQNTEVGYISDEAVEWLSKIKSFCDAHGVNFILASPPVLAGKKQKSSDWREIRQKVAGTALEPMFKRYFNTIIYEDDQYSRDGLHWKEDFLALHRQEWIDEIKKRLKEPVDF